MVAAIINKDNQILLQKRADHTEKFPNLWDISIAGHVSQGDNSEQTVIKEAFEEIGVKIKEIEFIDSFLDKRIIGNIKENQVYDLYVIRLDFPLSKYTFNDGAVAEIKFADQQEIVRMRAKKLFHPREQWIDMIFKKTI